MSQVCPIAAEVFGRARDQFESIVHELTGEVAGKMEHGQIEALLFREGTELIRLLLQGYLDILAGQEPRRSDVTGPEDVLLTHCRSNCERPLMS